MLIYLKPKTRRNVLIVSSVFLLILGARIGAGIGSGSLEVVAKVKPLSQFDTREPHIGLVVEVQNPKPENIAPVLATLENLQIRATWFLPATFCEAQSEVVKEIAGKGHEFGMKGTDEKPMDRLSPVEVKDRIRRAHQALQKLSIEPVPFFYPPLGRLSETLTAAAFEEGYATIIGSIDGTVIKGKPEEAGKKAADSMRPGDVLVLHLTKNGLVPEVTLVEATAKHLKNHGLSFVSLSMLAKGVR